MIVGMGMMARALSCADSDDVLFFCSGVSNSTELDEDEYNRERDLLKTYSDSKKKLVYFSSYFVNFEGFLNKNRYYRHKSLMEGFIRETFKYYSIFRLPQVVGRSKNPHTLTNFISNKILNKEVVHVFDGVRRNLIDVDDVVSVVKYSIEHGFFNNQTVNLIAPVSYEVVAVVDAFEKTYNLKAERNFFRKEEEPFEINLDQAVLEIFKKLGLSFDENYLNGLIRKYYSGGEI